uniref:Proton-coupled zinc antiporter SLC30A8 n=1 Tax=Cyclopterus lumpus TaxID=8103 RepID=A0A8C2WGY0_CYCLU
PTIHNKNNRNTQSHLQTCCRYLDTSSINKQATREECQATGAIKHCHDNSHAREDREREKKVAKRRLYVVSVICLVFMIGEILGGYLAGSLAVMTDAAHLLADFISFLISLLSLWLSSRPATHKLSYGWHRAEILGSLLSVFTIWLVTGVLVYLAVERLINNNYTIEGTIMLITSGCALLANIVMALILHQSGHGHRGRAQQHNASVRAAFVHVLGDLLQSVSVFLSAIIIFFKVSILSLSVHRVWEVLQRES